MAQALANKEDNKGTKMNVNLKENIAQIYARKGTRAGPMEHAASCFSIRLKRPQAPPTAK